MRQWFASFALACGCSVGLAQAASAQEVKEIKAQAQAIEIQIQVQAAQVQIQPAARIMATPYIAPGSRLTAVDAVFTGRVIGIEPVDVETPQVANGPKVAYRIATIMVSDSIHGLKKDAKQVRVGFVVQGNNVPGNVAPGGGVQILPAVQPIQPGFGPRRPFPVQMNLEVGQDGLFSVNKHHKEDFYLAPNFQTFVSRENNPGFEPAVKSAKQIARVAGDPVAALKSDSKEDRYTAAAFLLTKYRTASNAEGRPMKQEPISAEESKLILKALGEGDWKVTAFNAPIPGPLQLFQQLGVGANDGYNPVNIRTQEALVETMQKWLETHQDKYRVQRWVIDPNGKVLPGVRPVAEPGIRGIGAPQIQIQPLPAPAQDLPAVPAKK